MKQLQTIEWLPYPQNKPEKAGKYLVTFQSGKVRLIEYFAFISDTADGIITKIIKAEWLGVPQESVISYAELPKAYDPTATSFNFLTAVALMKEGKTIISDETGVMYNLDIDGIMEGHYADGTSTTDETFTLAEIEGEWGLV